MAGQVSKYFLGHDRLMGFVPMFYVDDEMNVPTWYSSFGLGVSGMLLGLIAWVKFARRGAYRFHWAGLSGLFILLSMDEVATIHESAIDPLREALHAGGLLYYTWVIPGAAFVAIVGLTYLPFLFRLPRPTGWRFLLAGAVYVGGAIGLEMITGVVADAYGEQTFAYVLVTTLEEFMEMLGVVIFIGALLEYLAVEVGEITVRFQSDDDESLLLDRTEEASQELPGEPESAIPEEQYATY
jgi:hypothetical protein